MWVMLRLLRRFWIVRRRRWARLDWNFPPKVSASEALHTSLPSAFARHTKAAQQRRTPRTQARNHAIISNPLKAPVLVPNFSEGMPRRCSIDT